MSTSTNVITPDLQDKIDKVREEIHCGQYTTLKLHDDIDNYFASLWFTQSLHPRVQKMSSRNGRNPIQSYSKKILKDISRTHGSPKNRYRSSWGFDRRKLYFVFETYHCPWQNHLWDSWWNHNCPCIRCRRTLQWQITEPIFSIKHLQNHLTFL